MRLPIPMALTLALAAGLSLAIFPVLAQSGGGGAPLSRDAYSNLDQRISALEQQLSDLTGQVERATFLVNQLNAKLDRMQADTDLRLKEAEQKGAGGGGSQNTAVPPPAANGAPVLRPLNAPTGQPTEFNPTMGTPSGNLMHQGAAPTVSAPPPAAAVPPPPPAVSALPGRTPQEQYDYAFGLLRGSDYAGATNAFKAFLAKHGNDPLAGNAMFWLGQIPYAQGQYEQAVPLFLEAYRKYPKSVKAAESLLKVGLAMSNLGKKKEACAAIDRFRNEFPNAADNLKRQAVAEKQKLKC